MMFLLTACLYTNNKENMVARGLWFTITNLCPGFYPRSQMVVDHISQATIQFFLRNVLLL